MSSEILINCRPFETRVAVMENGHLVDLMIERARNKGLVGSIYRGQVVRVLPGMQAAFVDIGLERAAFLYVGDVRTDGDAKNEMVLLNDEEDAEAEISPAPNSSEIKVAIEDLLHEGQYLLVQVAKEPLGTKGARITTHISLPGRTVVYLPTLNHLGVSRRIEDSKERDRLIEVIQKNRPDKGGFIVRTAAEGVSEPAIISDIEYLVLHSKEIYRNFEKKKHVGLIHSDLDIELRAVRDLFTEEVQRVVVDDLKSFKKVAKFVGQFMPKLKNKISFYRTPQPLFDFYGIDLEISRALERKVWLKSGGYIVFDEAEALVVVDVNTGKYLGKKDLEETILKTNLEAVKEIAHQLRIRNCGGIIVIDFIDMEKETSREKVLNLLNEELAKDRARTQVSGMSGLGLVEMTRKRIRPSLIKTLCEPCSYCDGKGFTKRQQAVAHEIYRVIERENLDSTQTPQGGVKVGTLVVNCHSSVMDWVYAEESEIIDFLESRIHRKILFHVNPNFHVEQFEIRHEVL